MNALAHNAHPDTPELEAYARGKLEPEADRQIEEHLERCESCCRTLSDLSSDTMVSLLRRPLPATPETRGGGSSGDAATMLHPAQAATRPPRDGATLTDRPGAKDPELPAELAAHSKYEMLAILGQGGMGNVYKAQHRMMNRVVALKVINSQLMRSEGAVQRFRREVQAAGKLSHPNIVTAYDAEQAGNAHFLVMEYVDGVDLAQVVRERGPLPVAEACEYIRQAALGLQHAHERGMVHRDIKPQNLMLQESPDSSLPGVVKILDFGLAQLAAEPIADVAIKENVPASAGQGHLTLTGAMMGTPDYISPEQARDAHSADIRADIYSLGCTLYFLLTGKPPFATGTPVEKALAHAEREPTLIHEFRNDLPQGLEAVLARMMAKKPAERFQTPSEVAAALATFSESRVDLAHQIAGQAHAINVRRQPSPLVPLAVAAAVLVAFFAALAGVIVVVTNQGRLVITSEVEDLQVVIKQGGEQVDIVDIKTGSQVRWLKSGKYELELKGDANTFKLDQKGFELSRLGSAVVHASWSSAGSGVVRSFTTADKTITQDGVSLDDGGWKIIAAAPRTARLFEVPDPQLAEGRFFYRARLRTENVKGRAFLEMWVRAPGMGESFSKGFHLALSGTNGWAEYEIPFLLAKGESTDLVRLNLVVEGTGTVWIKDIELRGKTRSAASEVKGSNPIVGTAAEATDYDRLRGSWVCTGGAREGKPLTPEEAGRMVLRFDSDEMDAVGPDGKPLKVKFRLGQTQSPKWIEFVNPDPKGSGEPNIAGIYELSGETLRLAFNDADLPRPRDFAPSASRDHFSGAFKRANVTASVPARSGGSVRAGVNLIPEGSLEASPSLPRGWSKWLEQGPEYKVSVARTGRTGSQSLLIEGQGTRAVVFANGVPVDRNKRYALKGWVKYEGETGRAIIKFNYFHDGKWLGVNDLSGITGSEKEWQQLEKTDTADLFPEASQIWVSCNIEGGGKAWFDDLELVAYDRAKLPADFDKVHGKHNRQTVDLALDRWVGCWETTFEHKPTAAVPEAHTIKGATKNRLILDNRYVLSYWRNDDEDEESFTLLTFDEISGAYRTWLFSSTGTVFERAGQWDAKSQTLTLDLKPPFPGVKGKYTERFAGNERIEGTLLVTGADGQVTRDARATFIKKLDEADDDILVAAGPAKTPAELAVLEKMAGRWTNRSTEKPSVWTPEGRVETTTEQIDWVLGGRFLRFRAFDDRGQVKSLSLMTYEPAEKSFHFWIFGAGVAGGQWRVAWDASSRGFHWRSIDMPVGWIGTAFNRWVDDDTFDDHLLIKDDQGRVMTDMQIQKKRVK